MMPIDEEEKETPVPTFAEGLIAHLSQRKRPEDNLAEKELAVILNAVGSAHQELKQSNQSQETAKQLLDNLQSAKEALTRKIEQLQTEYNNQKALFDAGMGDNPRGLHEEVRQAKKQLQIVEEQLPAAHNDFSQKQAQYHEINARHEALQQQLEALPKKPKNQPWFVLANAIKEGGGGEETMSNLVRVFDYFKFQIPEIAVLAQWENNPAEIQAQLLSFLNVIKPHLLDDSGKKLHPQVITALDPFYNGLLKKADDEKLAIIFVKASCFGYSQRLLDCGCQKLMFEVDALAKRLTMKDGDFVFEEPTQEIVAEALPAINEEQLKTIIDRLDNLLSGKDQKGEPLAEFERIQHPKCQNLSQLISDNKEELVRIRGELDLLKNPSFTQKTLNHILDDFITLTQQILSETTRTPEIKKESLLQKLGTFAGKKELQPPSYHSLLALMKAADRIRKDLNNPKPQSAESAKPSSPSLN